MNKKILLVIGVVTILLTAAIMLKLDWNVNVTNEKEDNVINALAYGI